ncbi:MAG: S41 family peptidase [Prolixibacteraceae bacterium]|nr:S41 family peptidase [Prolixibacteraceae bacterium]
MINKMIKKNTTKILIFSTIILLTTSCELVMFDRANPSTDPYENFNYLWNEIDKKYSYFEYKDLDWDAVKSKYEVQLRDSMSDEELFDVLANMMIELRDDHSNLIAPFNISRYNLPMKKPANFNMRTIKEFYLPNGRSTGAFFHDFLPGGDLAYIRYSSFSNPISNQQLDHIINRYSNTKGLIIDLRENGGGSINNVPMILERFVHEKTQVGYFINRNGEGHSDFSEPYNFYLNSYDSIRYMQPVAVLTDRGSYSATTMFSLATKALDNIILVGDTTGGGGGLPNGGELPNGWNYRFSITQLLDMNKQNFAEAGVPPDVTASYDWNDLTKDEILEKAMEELRK